ncbi:hypothetical protein FRB93_001215 [Tulasnella sp. JGI-2019a]|nr:hypothetical protein FRB93_001215 [Tulasnella sp. JGI-2019a]
MRFSTLCMLYFVASASAMRDSVQPPAASNVQRRQADISTTSYDYWWPYGPNGIYATTSVASIPFAGSSSTTIWWTPPPTSTSTPTTTPVSTSVFTPTVQVQPSMYLTSTGGISSDDTADPTSDADTSTTSSSDSDPETVTSSSSSSSSTATTTSTASSNFSIIRIHQPLKMAYFTPLFILGALALCVAVGMIITRCRKAKPSAPCLPSLLGGGGNKDDEKMNLRGSYDRQGRHLARENHGVLNWIRPLIRSRPTWLNRSRRDEHYATFGDLGRRLPPAKRLPNDDHDHEDSLEKDRGQDGSYGYGQWMTRRGMASMELTREYSREGDAEDIEIDLSKGWRHFSSLYGGSPDLEGQPHYRAASSSDQQSSLRDRELLTQIEDKSPTKSKYSKILNFCVPGMTRSSNKQSRTPKMTAANASSGNVIVSPNTATALAIPGSVSTTVRRASAGNTKSFSLPDDGAVGRKHQREAEIACDELSLNSRPYSLCDYRGDTPPPSSRFTQHMQIQTSLSPQAYEDLYSTNSSPNTLLIERTPRQLDGAVKHKSIRRLIMEKLRGPGTGGGSQGRLRYGYEYSSPVEEEEDEDSGRSNGSTPLVMGVDVMSVSGTSIAPMMEPMGPLRIVKKDHRDLLDPFHRELGTTLSPFTSELIHLYEEPGQQDASSPLPSSHPKQSAAVDSSHKVKGLTLPDRGVGSYTVALKWSAPTVTTQPLKHQKSTNSHLGALRTNSQRQHSRGASQSRGRPGGEISRVNTSASTIPSVYSPATTSADVGSPMPAAGTSRQKSFKAFSEERRKAQAASATAPAKGKAVGGSLGSAREVDVTSAAQMSRLSRRAPVTAARGTQNISKLPQGKTPVTPLETSTKFSERAEYPFPAPPQVTRQPPPRAQSPLPELPSGIMSPPLRADLFFSPSPSVDIASSKRHTKEKLKLDSERKTFDKASPSHVPKNGSTTVGRLSQMQPAASSTLKVGGTRAGRTLARTASRATTSTSSSATATPPPPSHFSFKTREHANLKVDMIVKSGYVTKERPSSPTGFGARASWNGTHPAEVTVVKGGGNSGTTTKRDSTCSSLDVEVYGSGIEQRLGI